MKRHLKRYFIILFFLLSILKAQNETESLLQTKCDGDKITYTIKASRIFGK